MALWLGFKLGLVYELELGLSLSLGFRLVPLIIKSELGLVLGLELSLGLSLKVWSH